MGCLNDAAGLDPPVRRDNTLPNVQEICKRITIDSIVAVVLPTSDPNFNSRVENVIDLHIANTRATCREILSFSSFLDSGLIDHIFGIEYCSFFKKYESDVLLQVRRITSADQPDPWDLSRFAEDIALYLQAVDGLDNYCQNYLTAAPS
ncbi:hypothetical protein [Mycobacterium sp.]|uniref:hypothetical protein n=1 Tax=Mycobacterium sp. TaxID=1785 RepID=UPI003F95373D